MKSLVRAAGGAAAQSTIDDAPAPPNDPTLDGSALDGSTLDGSTLDGSTLDGSTLDDSAESRTRGARTTSHAANTAPCLQLPPWAGTVKSLVRAARGEAAQSTIDDAPVPPNDHALDGSALDGSALDGSALDGSALGGSALDDSAESFSSAPGARSVLDRLLDEAEAMRDAEATSRREPSGAPRVSSFVSDEDAPRGAARASTSDQVASQRPSALQQRADGAARAFNRADALVSLAQGYLRGDRPDRSSIEVVLTIPRSSLRAGAALDPVEVGEIGETFVSGETARRLSCDAGVVEVVEDESGAPLSVGRKRRTITGALKRALRKRDAMCTYPGCTHRMFLEGHHIKHWADGGETSMRNAALLCSLHHRFVHEYGYAIELGSDQRPQFRDPHGRLVAEVPTRPAMADLGWPGIRAANASLAITADTIACGWDGTPAPYRTIVGHLAIVDTRSSLATCPS